MNGELGMRRVFIVLLLFLTACGNQATVVPTSVRAPLPTSIPNKTIASITVPSRFGVYSTTMPWRIYPGMPRTQDISYFEIYQGKDRSDEVGHATIAYYDTAEEIESAQKAILKQMEVEKKAKEVKDLGENARSVGPTSSWRNSDIVFVQCNTVVHITMPIAQSAIVDYARQLSPEIEKTFC